MRDCVADLIAAIDSGRVKGKQFSKEIEDFSPEELGRLSEVLLLYYERKFSLRLAATQPSASGRTGENSSGKYSA